MINNKVGSELTKSMIVNTKDTAKVHKSGNLDVYATPAMVAFCEQTCSGLVKSSLEKDSDTVGTKIDINHISASPLGSIIKCTAKLLSVENKKLIFSVEVFDNWVKIGSGIHERFIINTEKFLSNIKTKKPLNN